jgi:hypothetical protein
MPRSKRKDALNRLTNEKEFSDDETVFTSHSGRCHGGLGVDDFLAPPIGAAT